VARIHGQIYASDSNPALIGLFKNIQNNPDGIIAELRTLVNEYGRAPATAGEANRNPASLEEALSSEEAYYYWIRGRYNALAPGDKQSPQASAMFLFLNKTCFRGLYREGPHGFNVPFGNYKNPTIFEEGHLREITQLIQPVIFTCCDFVEAFARIEAGDFVYLDPPYAPETDTSFVGYVAEGFGTAMHRSLFDQCARLRATFLMSNANVTLVREAFPEPTYRTETILCRRAINSKRPNATTHEVLITNAV
jgi:DNA adenine methylase